MKRRWTIILVSGALPVSLLVYWLLLPGKVKVHAGVAPVQHVDTTDVQSLQLTHAVNGLAFSSSGESLLVLAGSRDGDKTDHIIRCNLNEIESTELFSTSETLQGLSVSPDGQYAYTARWRSGPSREAELLVIDAIDGGLQRTFLSESLDGFGFRITSDPTVLGISPDGGMIAVGAKLVDDQYIAGGHIGGEVCIFDAKAGNVIWRNRTVHTDILRNVVFSPDGEKLLSAGDDSLIRVWDAGTGELKSTLVGTLFDGVSKMEISPDGRYLASGGQGREEGGRVRVWDLEQGTFVHLYSPFKRESNVHVTFCSDGTLVAAGMAKDSDVELPKFELRAWRADDFSSLGMIGNGDSWVRALVSAPKGSRVVVGTWDGQVLSYGFNVD